MYTSAQLNNSFVAIRLAQLFVLLEDTLAGCMDRSGSRVATSAEGKLTHELETEY